MTLDASYAGGRASQIPVQSLNIDALSAGNLALGNSDLGGTSSYLTTKVPNPFQNLLPGTSLNSSTISRQQSLLPFPEFTSVIENDIPVGHYWYNALQVNLQQRTWHDLDTSDCLHIFEDDGCNHVPESAGCLREDSDFADWRFRSNGCSV